MKTNRQQRKKHYKTIAAHRINILMSLAEKYAKQGHFTYANRYTFLARKIAMRYLIQIPPNYKRNICKNCYSFLLPGKNAHIRINHGRVITKCHTCNTIHRFPINQK
jgi:ribonuclease P protein subunit RPR2